MAALVGWLKPLATVPAADTWAYAIVTLPSPPRAVGRAYPHGGAQRGVGHRHRYSGGGARRDAGWVDGLRTSQQRRDWGARRAQARGAGHVEGGGGCRRADAHVAGVPVHQQAGGIGGDVAHCKLVVFAGGIAEVCGIDGHAQLPQAVGAGAALPRAQAHEGGLAVACVAKREQAGVGAVVPMPT